MADEKRETVIDGHVPTETANSGKTIDDTGTASSNEFDETYDVYAQQSAASVDPAEARRVLRAIDWHILPLLMGSYMLQYLDKSSINFASVYGLQAGTHLHGQQYSWLASIFYFGYLVAQYPAGYLLQRYPAGRFLGASMLGWSVLLLTTPACRNFAGIATNRFLLGVTEAVVNPGFVLILSMWYTRDEQPLRLVAYYCMNGVAGIFGGLLGYAIGHITTGLAQWQYVFLIFGAVSFVWAVVFLAAMPDLPTTARFLDRRAAVVAVERVAANHQGVKNHHFKVYQLWQTLRDPKTWILFFMSVAAQIPNAAQSSFTSIVLQTFGFTTLQTQYMQIPGNVIQIASLLASGYVCSRWPNMRCLAMLSGNLVCVVAAGVLVGLDPGPDGTGNKWGRLVAVWLLSFISVGFSLSLTMVSSNVAGYTKKQLTGAFVFVGYCVGNIIGPQTFRASEAPLYRSAYIAILIGFSFKTIFGLVLYAYMWAANRKRDRAAAGDPRSPEERAQSAVEKGMRDITELDNADFRYAL
ncbi:hypothetical protein HMPREF1624_04181 [Sporothrix schenckii ATCC 58251]|uniref:Major facilitator superfamily (MFS) profile domain-containing protein n=1 Tax=Sporothrix schenckii (strain ATCC 58251 / de Perez 2211183) TaxID=1391915 RepID=U7PVP5_SPOS1|nr:hypothetical protein HMPREF1624_04181 [Sporothrix schenckii ATCC 58251]